MTGPHIELPGGAGGSGGVNIAASNTTYTSGTVVFSGNGNVTVSTNGQTVLLSAGGGAGGSFSAGATTLGNTSGNTGTVSNQLVLAGINNITLSQSTAAGGATISISGPATSAQQTGISGFANSETTYTSGSVTLSALANITIRSTTGQQFQFSVPSGANATGNLNAISNSNTTYTSGTIGLSELGAITIRSTTGNQFQFSVNSQSVQPETQTAISGIANSQTTYTSGTVSLSELGAITIRSTTGNQYQFSVNAQTGTYQSAIAASNTTYTSGLVVFTGSNMITVKSSGAGQTVILDATQTNQSAIKGFGASNTGNTAGNTGMVTGVDWVLAGSTNITVSQSTAVGGPNTLWLSVPNVGGGGNFSGGASNLGNTAGSTGITGTQLVIVGSGPVSLSQSTGANGGTLSINAPATSSLSATGLVSISTNGSTISIGAPYIKDEVFENFPMLQASLLTHVASISKTPFYWNERIPGALQPKTIALRLSAVTANTLQSFAIHFGVYTMVNSTSAALLGSASDSYNVSSGSSVSISAQRNYVLTSPGTVAAISSLTPGDYIFGLMFSAGATQSMNQSLYGASVAAGGVMGHILPGANQLSTGTSQGVQPLFGRGSTTVNALPANIVASDLVNQGSGASLQLRPWIFMRS